MARIRDMYTSEIAPALMQQFGYKSVMQIPKLDKVVINVGVGDAKENSKAIDAVMKDIAAITGQKPVPTYARKSVANFKLRQGMKIGVKVTLRGERMYEFVDRLFNLALPRVRDFKGINPNAFDGRGNYFSCSPRSSTTRWRRSAVWISALSPPRRTTRRPASFSAAWALPLRKTDGGKRKWLRSR